MPNIVASFVSGSGALPKDASVGAIVNLSAGAYGGSTYAWEFVSKPKVSKAVISNIGAGSTRVGPLDAYGVYFLKVHVDRFMDNYRVGSIALNVPTPGTHPVAPDPLFDCGGRVRNFSFELPGWTPGSAAFWAIEDDSAILAVDAGISRGRIIPSNFVVTSGKYAMCLGDDNNVKAFFGINDVFSIEQEVDFTDLNELTFEIKYEK